MIRVIFKNVGQGDSIVLEWITNGKKSIGIIDSNIYEGRNPTLEYLKENQVKQIEFIILSHLHHDHFSGFPEIFDYCLEKKIKIKYFFHTSILQVLDIYNRILTPKKVESSASDFFKKFDDLVDHNIGDVILVDCYTSSFQLTDSEYLSFFAPPGIIYHKIARNISRKTKNIVVSYPDINKLSTITCISNESRYALLTSDAPSQSFRFINKNIQKQLIAIQVPHHGSYNNINLKYWESVNKVDACPAIFSVGDKPSDKLPDYETVKFVNDLSFNIKSTNLVYGLCDFFNKSSNPSLSKKVVCLDLFSKRLTPKEQPNLADERFVGDKIINLF